MKFFVTVFILIISFQETFSQSRAQFLAQGKTYISTLMEYGNEQKTRHGINHVGFRLFYEELLRRGFSIGGEVAIRHYTGQRDFEEVNATAIGIAYLLKWHCIRLNGVSVYFEHGGGIISTKNGFPPKGTKLNGQINIGLGAVILLNNRTLLVAGLRDYHSSNGNGFADNNPAYDATITYVGISYALK